MKSARHDDPNAENRVSLGPETPENQISCEVTYAHNIVICFRTFGIETCGSDPSTIEGDRLGSPQSNLDSIVASDAPRRRRSLETGNDDVFDDNF